MLASIANVGKNVCFLLSSASRASINVRFAKRNNIGDISGKSVSQFTASTLIGVGLGMMLSKMIDITMISQLYSVFFLLTSVNVAASYLSVKVIDETHFNNQRAFIVFNEYFKSNQERVMSVTDANDKEVFCFPNVMNMKYCKFIRYGHFSINEVLESSKPHYYA
jgi:Vitamin B6 photo-protection and homoeostasis